MTPLIPPVFDEWFAAQGWQLHAHQRAMLEAAEANASALLVAPTGGGKTLAGFLPSLAALSRAPAEGLHTLYISPLKALANDIHRNLERPVTEMNLPVSLAARTGDTSSHQRKKQRDAPPNILLTTPESLALLLSYPDAAERFSGLRHIIIDEIHAFASGKRGDQAALLLARLYALAPQARRVGLSATVSDPQALARWIARPGEEARLITAAERVKPQVGILIPARGKLPLAGHFPRHAVSAIYAELARAKSAIVFVNTRSQSEMLFQALWDVNESHLPIALHHGSLTREQRKKVEEGMATGILRAVVATSSLDLGIDWGNVDLVIHAGAPKGISRLLQRTGRSNHRFDAPSRALLVPANAFEYVECAAAIEALDAGVLDDAPPSSHGALDVLAQHVMNCACAAPIEPEALYREIRTAYPYAGIGRETFDGILAYVIDGGYVLNAYERHHRLRKDSYGRYTPSSARAVQRHRMNIGTIVESEKLKVMRVTSRPGGKRGRVNGVYLGEVEERLMVGMNPGDSFLFAGQNLRFERIRDLVVEVSPSAEKRPKIPVFAGGKMPMSTSLAATMRGILSDPKRREAFPPSVSRWLSAQARVSELPGVEGLLVETFPHAGRHYLVAYPFAGRPAHQALSFLMTQRMERLGLHPMGFTISDYGLAVSALDPVAREHLPQLWEARLLERELDAWMEESNLLKRGFRATAIIAGLIERRIPGQEKSGRQVTFSTDLLYDVLRKYQPQHLLLQSNKRDILKDMLDMPRLEALLMRAGEGLIHRELTRLSPLSIPLVVDTIGEQVGKSAEARLLDDARSARRADTLFKEAARHDA